jgi:hypothetical protein
MLTNKDFTEEFSMHLKSVVNIETKLKEFKFELEKIEGAVGDKIKKILPYYLEPLIREVHEIIRLEVIQPIGMKYDNNEELTDDN